MTSRTDNQSDRDALRRVKLISELSDEEFEALLRSAQKRRYADQTILFLEGEPCDGMLMIVRGAVSIYKSSSSGREIQIALQAAPASVAEVPVFDGGAYPASARAVGDVVAYLVSKQAFAALIRNNPDVGLKVLAVAGQRLRTLVRVLHQMTFGGTRQRLAQLLLDEEERMADSYVDLGQTHREIATRLGTAREVISRNLSRFQSEGLVRVEGRRIWIEDRDGLRAEADTEIR